MNSNFNPNRIFPREIHPSGFSGFEVTSPVSSLPLIHKGAKPVSFAHNSFSVNPNTQVSAAIPTVFNGTVGHYTPPQDAAAASETAVLMVSAWGFEEMSSRRFFRSISEKLAENGIPSLRFDYPGTGDSLDIADFSTGLEIWENSLVDAVSVLKKFSNCSRLVLVGQSLGASLTLRASQRLKAVDGVVLLAPVLSGKLYLRELAIWARTIDNNLQVPDAMRDLNPGSIASLRMPRDVADDIKKLNLTMPTTAPAERCLVLLPRERPQDTDFANHLGSLGCQVDLDKFVGYDQMISNVTYSKVPPEPVNKITEWISALKKPALEKRAVSEIADTISLNGPDFIETHVRFGDNNRLSGVICEPLGIRRGATVLLMSTAYERHASWGCINLQLARYLAKSGIASFRFDTANVADSPPRPGFPEEVLYTDSQQDDIREALDFLESLNMHNFVASGRCSGAYLAFQSAIHQQRVRGIVGVNPYVFHWRQGDSVEEFLKFVPKDLSAYAPLLFKGETIRRLWNGDIKLKAAILNISRVGLNNLLKLAGPFFSFLPWVRSQQKNVRASFDVLKARNTPFSLIYSDNDQGLRHFHQHFGADGEGIKLYSNVEVTIIKDADHNLTPMLARVVYFEAVKNAALKM